VDVVLAASLDRGVTFSLRESVTDKPWDPTINAPWAHGHPEVRFIGEYFGLDADTHGFRVVWTDTRTGMQELFTAKVQVQTSISEFDPRLDSDTVFIPLHGSAGGVLINLKTGEVVPVPYPEWNPESRTRNRANAIRDTHVRQIDALVDAFALIEDISDETAQSVKDRIMDNIKLIAAQGTRNKEEIPKTQLPTEITSVDDGTPKSMGPE
jgi:hypothetical protein